MQPASRIAILGAGLMGRLLAHMLAAQGHRIELHEADDGTEASSSPARIAAAMLAPLAESAITEPNVVRMGQYSLGRWPQILATLPEPVYFQQNGTLLLWHRQDAAEAQRLSQVLVRNQQATPSLPAPLALDAAGLRHYEPAVADRFAQGLLLPGEGQLDNRQLLAALLRSLQTQGVALHWGSARDPADFAASGAQGVVDAVIDCRGIGARQAGPQALPELRGVRGEVARLSAPGVTLQRPTRLVHPRYPIYIAPKQDGIFVIGATEIETDDLSPPSLRSVLELLSAAYTVDPGFGEARILETAAQVRPTLPDNLPLLRFGQAGPDAGGPRLLQVNGLYRHGFMIAPALADCVAQWLDGGQRQLAADLGLNLQPAP